MPNSLDPIIAQFLSLEATPHVRALLSNAIAEAAVDLRIEKRHFEFNTFDVEFDFVASTVSVADILSSNAEATLPLSQLRAVLDAESDAQP
jgi:hypothetical protein